MNKYREKRLIAMRLCSIVLCTSIIAVSARAQTLLTAPATGDRSDTTSVAPFASGLGVSFPPSGFRPKLAERTGTNIDKAVSKELDKAWRISGDGTSGRVAVVLIFRMEDGSYTGKLQVYTNEYRKSTFKWNPAAIAIIHTHPNSADPKPAEQDKRVADKYGVPNFTITNSGMYVYDPVTKKTSKVLNSLDWLNLSAYPDKFKRWLGA